MSCRRICSKLILMIIIFSSSNIIAQHKFTCYEANNYYTKHIQYLYSIGQNDSINSCIRHWNEFCDNSEELSRMRILWAIKNGKFNENIYDDKIIEHLIQYREKIQFEKNIESLSDVQKELRKYYFSNTNFNRFTKLLSQEILKGLKSKKSLEYLFTKFYANEFDSLFLQLKKPYYMDSKLHSYYNYTLNNIRNSYEEIISLVTGYWWPLGTISFYGSHPLLGASMGIKRNKITTQITAVLIFLEGHKKYTVLARNDRQESHFIRGYMFSAESYRDIIQRKYSEFNVGIGVGLEYYVSSSPFEDGYEYNSSSFLTNFSLGYKKYWSNDLSKFSDIRIILNRYGVFWKDGNYSISAKITFGFSLTKRRRELLSFLRN